MDMRDLRFGCEVETIRRTRRCVAEAVQTVVGGQVRHVGTPANYDPYEVTDNQGRVWKVVADSSLSSVPSHLRAEVVSPILTYGDIPELQQVVRAVRTVAGAKTDSKRTGLHVHVDASAFDGRKLANLAKMFYKQEELIIRALGVTPERLARYCRPLREEFIRAIDRQKPKTRDELNRLWFGYRNTHPARYDSTRYCLLNLHSAWRLGTVEYRGAVSTLHAGKVKAVIQFCLALTAKALNARAASSKKRKANGKSDKYDFRVFALHLGLIGDEFKSCRKHLLANLAGSSAWKNGRPKPKVSEAAAATAAQSIVAQEATDRAPQAEEVNPC